MKKNIISFILGAVIFSTITAYTTTGNLIEVFYNVDAIVVDGVAHPLEQKPFIYNGSVYVPLRFVGESLGKKVSWNSQTKTVLIEESYKKDKNDGIEEYKLEISDTKEKLELLSKQLINNTNPKDIKTILINFNKDIGDETIKNIYFAKETGEMYCEPDIMLPEDYDAKTRPWYSNTKQEGEYISEIYTNAIDNQKYITITKAIYENEKFIGVVGIDFVVSHEK